MHFLRGGYRDLKICTSFCRKILRAPHRGHGTEKCSDRALSSFLITISVWQFLQVTAQRGLAVSDNVTDLRLNGFTATIGAWPHYRMVKTCYDALAQSVTVAWGRLRHANLN